MARAARDGLGRCSLKYLHLDYQTTNNPILSQVFIDEYFPLGVMTMDANKNSIENIIQALERVSSIIIK